MELDVFVSPYSEGLVIVLKLYLKFQLPAVDVTMFCQPLVSGVTVPTDFFAIKNLVAEALTPAPASEIVPVKLTSPACATVGSG